MLRVLIAGVGSIGRRHLANLFQLGVRDVALCRRRPERLKEAPDLPVFTDLRDALASKPDVVIVSNPTAHHLNVALPAAHAGCKLFVEKPLSHSWEGVEEFLSVVKTKNLVVLVGFDLRFDPGLCQVKALLDEGRIGRVAAIQAQVGGYLPDWRPWQDYRRGVSAQLAAGGGVILDLVHELDYVSWLIGPVVAVSCFIAKTGILQIETEDTAAMVLRFENGVIGTIHLDYIQRTASRTCRVIGEEGTIVWDYYAKKVVFYEAEKHRWQNFEYPKYERNDRYLAEMRHLIACVDGREEPKVDAIEASRVLKVALAAKESALSGRVFRVDP